ncbi:MAG: 16S rRNA (cytidine(1402)-2'-O)-methyltransferase, partial [Actinomycetes bacterium]
VRRGGLGELAAWAGDGVRGEVTVVVAGAAPTPAADPADLVGLVRARVEEGQRMKDAVSAVATEAGVARRELYQATLRARDVRGGGTGQD